MKKILISWMFAFCFTLAIAQPCNNFNSGMDNWVGVNYYTLETSSVSPSDGSPYLRVSDGAFHTYIENSQDFNDLGQNYLNSCLCFDYKMFNDGSGPSSIHPTIRLYNNADQISFVATILVTENSDWVTVCAPIMHSLAGTGILPSSVHGQWHVPPGTANPSTYFNSVLDNVTRIEFIVDNNSSYTTEIIGIDNVCVTTTCYPDIDISFTEVISCHDNELHLFSTAASYQTVVWTLPNGQTVSGANPTISLPLTGDVTRSDYSGVYTCVVTNPDGSTWTKTVNITIPDDCCLGDIEYEVSDCYDYTFDLITTDVDVEHSIWRLDGVVVSRDDIYTVTLSPGTHEICVNYIGTLKTDENEICCGLACVEVEVPGAPLELLLSLYACDFQDGSPVRRWFNPCSMFADIHRYTLSGSNPGYNYNSDDGYTDPNGIVTKGCISHALIPGTYTFTIFDENDCVTTILSITVSAQIGTIVECTVDITVPCGSGIDLRDSVVCEACGVLNSTNGGVWEKFENGSWVEITSSFVPSFSEDGQYRFTIKNEAECVKCIMTINVTTLTDSKTVIFTDCSEFDPGFIVMTFEDLMTYILSVYPEWCGDIDPDSLWIDDPNSMPTIPTGQYAIYPGGHMVTDGSFTIKPSKDGCCELIVILQCFEVSPPAPNNSEFDVEQEMNDDALLNQPRSQTPETMFKIIPNPTSRSFRIIPKANDLPVVYDRVQITNTAGELVYDQLDVSSRDYINLDTKANGTYFVTVQTGIAFDVIKLTLVR